MVDKESADRKVKEGWIRSWMMIEAMAVNEDAVKTALEKHVKKMGEEDETMVYKTEFREIKRVENPFPNIKEAYSGVVEIELVTGTFDKLFYLSVNYGPSAVEILEPEKLTIDMGEAQGVLNSMADIIHRFAARMGGATIET